MQGKEVHSSVAYKKYQNNIDEFVYSPNLRPLQRVDKVRRISMWFFIRYVKDTLAFVTALNGRNNRIFLYPV